MRPIRAMARPGAALLALCVAGAAAQPLAPAPQPPGAAIEQHLDTQLPLDLPLVDSSGRAVRLGRYFDHRPVLLVLGYYRCPQLCGLLMHGLLEALHDSRLPRSDYRIVRVSIDPADTPAGAAARREADLAYADFLQGTQAPARPLDLQLLTGQAPQLQALARQAGFRYEAAGAQALAAGGEAARFAHPAAVIVLTADGRVSRYLMGVRFDPWQLRLALVDAGRGRIGNLSDRIALLCAHVDPQLGRHSAAVLQGVRGLGVSLVLALALGLALLRPRSTGLQRRPDGR